MAHGSVVALGAEAPRPTCWWAHLSRCRQPRGPPFAGRRLRSSSSGEAPPVGRRVERPARPPRSLRASSDVASTIEIVSQRVATNDVAARYGARRITTRGRAGGGLRGRRCGHLEAGAAEHAGRARVHRGGRDPRAARVDRVALEDGRAVLGRVGDGGVQQRARDARSPRRLRDDEAVDRPTRRRPPAAGSSATWATARRPRAAPARPSRPPCRRRRSPPGPGPGRSRRRARGGPPRFWSTVVLLQFEPGFRQNWHQHHLLSDTLPKRSAIAGHRSGPAGRMWRPLTTTLGCSLIWPLRPTTGCPTDHEPRKRDHPMAGRGGQRSMPHQQRERRGTSHQRQGRRRTRRWAGLETCRSPD